MDPSHSENIIREVICIWQASHWQNERIACASELREDLPRCIHVGYDGAKVPFVLSGFLGETPAYRQACSGAISVLDRVG